MKEEDFLDRPTGLLHLGIQLILLTIMVIGNMYAYDLYNSVYIEIGYFSQTKIIDGAFNFRLVFLVLVFNAFLILLSHTAYDKMERVFWLNGRAYSVKDHIFPAKCSLLVIFVLTSLYYFKEYIKKSYHLFASLLPMRLHTFVYKWVKGLSYVNDKFEESLNKFEKENKRLTEEV